MNQQAAADRSWRALLGRKGPGPYAVHHCNLRCRACAYLSPVRPRAVVDPEALRQDLRILATRYHASEARVLGGEPLLHPDLVAVLDAVRTSGICDTIRVLTNGLLLHRMTTEFWSTIDAVSVSMYQGRCIDEAAIEPIRQTAEGHGVRINFKPFRYFRESYSELGTPNQALAERIYRTCQMANVWRCHTLWSGHLFRCPQSLFLPTVLAETDRATPVDGLPVQDDPGFVQRLLDFLESDQPLWSCTYCLGSVGRVFPHAQIQRREWRAVQSRPTEELMDWTHLALLESNPGMKILDASYMSAPVE